MSSSIKHNENTSWLSELEKELRKKPLWNDKAIGLKGLGTLADKMANWKDTEEDLA